MKIVLVRRWRGVVEDVLSLSAVDRDEEGEKDEDEEMRGDGLAEKLKEKAVGLFQQTEKI